MSKAVILCVDDERLVLTALKAQLRRHFGDMALVETADSGDEGLQVFEELVEEGVDLPVVISDQLMPGMKGEEFLARVHARASSTLTILLTGQATVEAVGDAVNRAGLYRYLGKPWSEADLVQTVREAIRAWEQARELDRRAAELQSTHTAALRFVPRELLALLGRERVADVSFGDHAVVEVSMLLSDMRDFTSLIQGMGPRESFAFVNEYVQRMEAPIRKHGGFVVNIEGDAILALFPNSPEDALRAGIESHRVLAAWNVERADAGLPEVGMGVGINSGDLLLGTIGGEERLQCDVVGDPVNLCSRLESLTKQYGTAMLVSGSTVSQLDDPSAFRLREVDLVQPKGSSLPVTLWEVLDALPEEEARKRLLSLRGFEEARAMCRAGEIDAARDRFEAVLAADPHDGVAALLLARCHRLAASPHSLTATGITVLDHK